LDVEMADQAAHAREVIRVRMSQTMELSAVEREVADHAVQPTGNQAGRWVASQDIL
jgi:hypothetical protein